MEPIYNINDNAKYNNEIKALQNTDSSSATDTFNPLVEKILNNIHAVKKDSISLSRGEHALQFGDNLNDMINLGSYFCDSENLAKELLNCPIIDEFRMITSATSHNQNHLMQTLITKNGDIYTRTISDETSLWQKILNEQNLVNNLTTLEAGYAADARTVKELNDKFGGFQFYSHISQLGIIEGTETMEEICAAMPNNSVLVFAKITANTSTAYPIESGILSVLKLTTYRTRLNFITCHSNRRRYEWDAYYDTNLSPVYSGWIAKNDTIFELDHGTNIIEYIESQPPNIFGVVRCFASPIHPEGYTTTNDFIFEFKKISDSKYWILEAYDIRSNRKFIISKINNVLSDWREI